MFGHYKKTISKALNQLRNKRAPLSSTPVVDDKQFLFIGGLHRSGTSILHRLLCEHPITSGFHGTGVPEDEGQHLQSVFKSAHHFGGPGEFALNPDARLAEDSSLVTESNREKLLREWGAYYDLRKSILLEKSPPNLLRSRFLRQMFPNSKFIFVVRHPIAVSLATEKWTTRSIIERLLHWNAAYSIMLDDIGSASDCLVIRYEDLVEQPAEQLNRICDFVGIHHFSSRETVVDHNENYFLDWERRYQSEINTLQAVLPEDRSLLKHFRYSLASPYVFKD